MASGCRFCLWLFPALKVSTLKILHLASKALDLCAEFLSKGYSLYLPKHQSSKSLKWSLPCESHLILSNTNQEQFITPLALQLPLCLPDCQWLNKLKIDIQWAIFPIASPRILHTSISVPAFLSYRMEYQCYRKCRSSMSVLFHPYKNETFYFLFLYLVCRYHLPSSSTTMCRFFPI